MDAECPHVGARLARHPEHDLRIGKKAKGTRAQKSRQNTRQQRGVVFRGQQCMQGAGRGVGRSSHSPGSSPHHTRAACSRRWCGRAAVCFSFGARRGKADSGMGKRDWSRQLTEKWGIVKMPEEGGLRVSRRLSRARPEKEPGEASSGRARAGIPLPAA